MFTLAHLSDVHLSPLPRPRPAELLNKRGLGFINWLRGRRLAHSAEALDAIAHDIKLCRADHIAVTGDLVNLSLEAEYKRARALLERLGPPRNVTFVPGNHDIYVRGTEQWPAKYWGDYMRGDDGLEHFPFLRRRGDVALIALSTALPTGPFLATGRLGDDQLASLARALDETSGLFRVVLIHHPPVSPSSRYLRRLTDAAEFRDVLAGHGAELVIHGHDHCRSLVWLDGPTKQIPAVGVPSASAQAPHGHEDTSGYNLFHIDGAAGAWRCEMVTRQLRADGSIGEIPHQTLS